MKLAIKKIEFIPCSRIHSWSHVGRNDAISVTTFVDGPFQDLKFTELTASLEEEWIDSPSGIYSNAKTTGIIRANKEQIRSILSYLVMSKNVFRITTMEDVKYMVGSLDFTPKTLFKLVIAELTTSEYQFTISCKSAHGLVIDTSA